MFSTSTSCKVTAACVVAVMMMMLMMTMAEAAAMLKPGSHSKHGVKTHKKSNGAEVETVPLHLDPSSVVPPRNIRPLENDSISPWTYNITHDDSLYPSVLSEAHCLLQGCLDSNGQEDQNLKSSPIMRQVLVLRRVRPAEAGQSYYYKLETRLIAVGCTCVRPIVNPQL